MNMMLKRSNEDDAFGEHTLVVNSNNPIVKNIVKLNSKTEDAEKVKIGEATCQISYFGRLFRIRSIMIILILVFSITYILSIISFGPWF